ncbi:MAG: hypothetical protein KFH87_05085 [Bacteroidetes bacterium]|nr:hypothetical protein [Bacteroidota bacterium]
MLDTLGSYIIGGIVLMMMMGLIFGLQDTARDAVMNEISQLSLAEMSQIMERELNNMGYRVPDDQKIISITHRSITFLSDYDNNGIVDTLFYEMQRTASGPVVTRRLSRPGQVPLEWSTRGSMVLFTAYDEQNNVTFDPATVRSVEASMLTSNVLYNNMSTNTNASSSEDAGSLEEENATLIVNHQQLLAVAVDCQAGAYWHKRLYPRNLTVEAPQLADSFPGEGGNQQDPGTGDPGTGDPGTGDPGTGDPGTGDPGTGDPEEPVIVPQ